MQNASEQKLRTHFQYEPIKFYTRTKWIGCIEHVFAFNGV